MTSKDDMKKEDWKVKKKVLIVFGGMSVEHEVSLQSARNICNAIDKNKYEIILLGISKGGGFYYISERERFTEAKEVEKFSIEKVGTPAFIRPLKKGACVVIYDKKIKMIPFDVAFPVLHGPYGEDGTIQGLFKMVSVPFVGAGVLSSAICVDKEVMKRLLLFAKIPVANYLCYRWWEKRHISYERARERLGTTLFVKPANLGSSVGISKVRNEREFRRAIKEAFKYDSKVIVEEFIEGREIECSVLGNEKPVASFPGEIIPRHEFYSYDAKYIDSEGAELIAPAKLSKKLTRKIREFAVETYKTLLCEGMARVDFFLRPSGEVLVNEVNTIPGFTAISMYPKLWEVTGLNQKKLIDRLIAMAIERYRREKTNKI